MKRRIVFTLILILLSSSLLAQEKPERGLSLRNAFGGMLNPSGVGLTSKLYFTEPLYGEREGVLWDTARIEMGITNKLSPAYDDVSLELFVEPIAIFDFRSNIGVRYAYDALGYGYTPLSSYDENYSDAGSLPSQDETGLFISLTPRVKAAAGPIIFLNSLTWNHYSFGIDSNDIEENYFYEPTNDVILKESEYLVKNSTTVLYDLPFDTDSENTYLAGAVYDILYVPDSKYMSQKASLIGAVQVPVDKWDMSIDAALILGAFIENKYYAAKDGYIAPAVQIGVTKGL